jgi:hypothetical protein
MRFYFTAPGAAPDEGIEFASADAALREATLAALALAADRESDLTKELRLDVRSDDGPVGSVAVKVIIVRS